MRKQVLDDETIKEVLRLIDSKQWTQVEIAKRFHVSQGTISRYNRVKRMQFKIEANAKLIAKLNLEILDLKEKLNMDTTEERRVPTSFSKVELTCQMNPYLNLTLQNDKDTAILDGFYTSKRVDAVQFLERHPEYYLYTIIDNSDKNKPMTLKSNGRVNVYGWYLSPIDFGHIGALEKVTIIELNITHETL